MTRFVPAVILLLCAFAQADAQLSISVIIEPNPSPYVSDWRTNPNTVRLVVTNPTAETYQTRIDAYVAGDKSGRVAETKLDAGIAPVIIPPGTTILNGIDAHVVEEGAIRYIGGARSEAEKSGRLPEDHFSLCARVVRYPHPNEPLSEYTCAMFDIALRQVPMLIAPADASAPPVLPAFQWTPVPLGMGKFASYEMTLVELDPGQTNASNAIETNIPLARRTVTVPVYQYLPADPPLKKGATYAWRVRAYDPGGRYRFLNGGLSEIWTFVFTPPPPAMTAIELPPSVRTGKFTQVKPGAAFGDVQFKNVIAHILTNTVVKGRLLYTFDPGLLLPEFTVDAKFRATGDPSKLEPLPYVNLRLVRCIKCVPSMMMYGATVQDVNTGRIWSTTPEVVATTSADAQGNFSFSFIEGDKTVLAQHGTFRSGGGEFVDIKEGTLYKYYRVEVVNPYYCSSQSEIAADPGAVSEVTLSSLVRTYNLDVAIRNQESHLEVGSLVMVYASRPGKGWIPFTVPEDEGELLPPAPGAVKFNLNAQQTHKYASTALGYVISAHPTADAPQKGHVLFTRLVRNVGGLDGYMLSARTPEKKPDGTYNMQYYLDNDGAQFFQKSTTASPGQLDLGGFSGEVVFNSQFHVPTFTTEILIVPRLPRAFGMVKRSDSHKPIPGAWIGLRPNPPLPFIEYLMGQAADKNGAFDIRDIMPTTASMTFDIVISAPGFKTYTMPQRAFAKGQQLPLGVIELDPRLMISRSIVDEKAQPLPGVRCVFGNGMEVVSDQKGVVVSPAVPGWQFLHMEKRTQYADKDSIVQIQDNAFEALGALLVDKLVMFEARRRLEVRVVNALLQPVPGAVVILEDFYEPPSGHVKVLSPYRKVTGADGKVSFAYLSASDVAHVGVTVPNSDYVPKKRTFYGIKENGTWSSRTVLLVAGGHLAGTVYAGPKRGKTTIKKAGKYELVMPATPGVPVRQARVWVDGYPDLYAFTDDNGKYDLRGVPAGQRIIHASKAATSVDDQVSGESQDVAVVALQLKTVDFYLTQYRGMDITALLGFPIEIDKLTELSGGKIRIDGAFVKVPANSAFVRVEEDERYDFHDVDLMPMSGAGTPAPARPVASAVPLLTDAIDVTAETIPAELAADAGLTAQPVSGDFLKGGIVGQARVKTGSLPLNSNEMAFGSGDAQPRLAVRGSTDAAAPSTTYAALIAGGGAFPSNGAPLRVTDATGGDLAFSLFKYATTSSAKDSYLDAGGLHLRSTVHATIPGCGPSMGSSCDVGLALGDVTVAKSGLTPVDCSAIPAQDIAVQKWKIHASSFSLVTGFFAFDGSIRAPLVEGAITDATCVNVPFTGMELRPAELAGGHFTFTELDMLGIAKMKITSPVAFGSDSKSWFLATSHPVIPAVQSGGKPLQGLDPAGSIVLNTFYLRSDATKDISASNDAFVVYDVGSVVLNSFQFGFNTVPYMEMQASLTLIDFPDLAPQAARLYWTPGGVFGMDGVILTTPYIAGGVKMTIANGLLGPKGFTSEGTWGKYDNRIFLDGKFSFAMHLRHKKIPGGYSTIAEIINPGYATPMHQTMFGNASGPDVTDVYGRTQVESDMSWSTTLSGWYATPELAGKDSIRFTVQGSGGNGTVAVGDATFRMKGANGGLSLLYREDRPSFPKGPQPEPPLPDGDSPFSGMTVTPDFGKMALISTCHVEKEISPGTSFKGDMTSVISFGSTKFWSFFAAGEGQIQNPPCLGSAVFLAGLNYQVGGDQLQQIVDYSISKRPLPDKFHTMTGFFTQVGIVMPIPGTPNFDIDVAIAHIGVHCTMGGEGRLGLNFNEGTTFFFGIYAEAEVDVTASASVSLFGLAGVSLKGNATVKADAGGWATYNNDAGASFDITGSILGDLTMQGCASVLGIEHCFDATVFKVGGTINGRIGAGKYLDIKPEFEFLGI